MNSLATSLSFPIDDAQRHTTAFTLPHLAVLRVQGDDAATFLHNQFTTDIKGAAINSLHLSGLCTHKGRVLANPWVYRHDEGIDLIVPLEIRSMLLLHLKKFILRAKVSLEESSNPVLGAFQITAPAQDTLTTQSNWLPLPYHSPIRRYLMVVKQVDEIAQPSPHSPPEAIALWRMASIHAQIPEISMLNQEQFIPQSINLDLLDAVNFKKGCYPGQEIVARTHYLSEAKRRAFFVTAIKPIEEGAIVSTSNDEEAGRVINAQSLGEWHYGLIELKMSFIDATLFTTGTPLRRDLPPVMAPKPPP